MRIRLSFLLLTFLCLHFYHTQGALLLYASNGGEGIECTLFQPCSIYTAASMFSGVSPNQGILFIFLLFNFFYIVENFISHFSLSKKKW